MSSYQILLHVSGLLAGAQKSFCYRKIFIAVVLTDKFNLKYVSYMCCKPQCLIYTLIPDSVKTTDFTISQSQSFGIFCSANEAYHFRPERGKSPLYVGDWELRKKLAVAEEK